MATEAEFNQFAFSAKLYNVRPLVNLLRSLSFIQKVIVDIEKDGIIFSVQDSQCVIAKAYLKKSFFAEYKIASRVESEPLQCCLFVNNLIECLTLFYGTNTYNYKNSLSQGNTTGVVGGLMGNISALEASGSNGAGYRKNSTSYNPPVTSTTAQFAYDGDGSEFELMLEDNGVISICRLATFIPDPFPDLDFDSSPTIQSVIIRSEWLQDLFNELESNGEIIMFSISNTSPILKIVISGSTGSTEVKYLNNEKVLEAFSCLEDQQFRYKLNLVTKCQNALNQSLITKISINSDGFLLFQFKIHTETAFSFVSFVFSPLVSL